MRLAICAVVAGMLALGSSDPANASFDEPRGATLDAPPPPSRPAQVARVLHVASAAGYTVNLNQNSTGVSSPVARFTADSSRATTSDFTATIDWGDRTAAETLAVVQQLGSFFVQPSPGGTILHSYSNAGTYDVVVTLSVRGNPDPTLVHSTAVVTTTLSLEGATLHAYRRVAFAGAVATLTDTRNRAWSGDAVIDWGDGTVGPGVVWSASGSPYSIQSPPPGHAYAAPGAYSVKVSIRGFQSEVAEIRVTAIVK